MATIQLVVTDEDRAQYEDQARKDGMSVSTWLQSLASARIERARERFGQDKKRQLFKSVDEMQAFFEKCRERDGSDGEPEREPDWEEHLKVISESRSRGLPDV